MTRPLLVFAVSLFALPGCHESASNGVAGAAGNSFKATDACAVLPKEKVAELTGLKVEKAILSSATEATATTPGFSACTYSFAEGGTLGFYARQSPQPDTPDTVAMTRKAVTDGMGAKTVDVGGLGTSAFSAQPMDQLHVFFGGDKYIYFMVDRAPIAKPIPEVERTLASAVIG
ncbi:hypothetical protein P6144_09380 [Sphingomonas sp. HITSZ_GF]|uniref:hypothetical protein n=1 Tax=Sphingomonas sp. HITSZ_GF TaxID=3037247 RepID=UPI00240D5D8E|nr:hypothetical protein [Sphingomonas sp. HITSZ_GF]MDG2533855.1 hypothetical protein [Sphingomonas sp. HITSZ_GF]